MLLRGLLEETTLSSIMPKDLTEKKERKEKKEKREKKKKEVAQEAPAEVPTTDVPEDVEMENAEKTKVDFSRSTRPSFDRSDSCTPTTQVTKKSRREKKEEQGGIVVPVEELSPIAHPLAQRKLLKKLNKAVKKGANSFTLWLAADRYGYSSLESPSSKTRCERGGERYQEGRERVSTTSTHLKFPLPH